MSDQIMLDVGQAQDLKMAMRRNNFDNKALHALVEGRMLSRVGSVIKGTSEIVNTQYIAIDCSTQPTTPEGFVIHSSLNCGWFRWDSSKLKLFVSEEQKKSGSIRSLDLVKITKQFDLVPSNILDFLLLHPHLIPESWWGEHNQVGFWGTKFKCLKQDGMFVRYLDVSGNHVQTHMKRIDLPWNYSLNRIHREESILIFNR